jgi:hypothetical protein
MNGFHVQGVAEDESDSLSSAEVGQPIPGEDALDGDDKILAKRGDGIEKDNGVGGKVSVEECFPFMVEHA